MNKRAEGNSTFHKTHEQKSRRTQYISRHTDMTERADLHLNKQQSWQNALTTCIHWCRHITGRSCCKYHFCHDKRFAMTNKHTKGLLRQAYFCHNKRHLLLRQTCVCHNKSKIVATKLCCDKIKYFSQQTFCCDKNMFVAIQVLS